MGKPNAAKAAEAAAASETAPATPPAPTGAAAGAAGETKRRSGGTVTVACKIPNGFVLQCYDLVDSVEPSPSGARACKVAQKVGEPITLNGFTLPPPGVVPTSLPVGGFGLTHNVPADVWEKWHKDNKDSDIVKNGLIFASPSAEKLADAAKERRNVVSGLEPLDTKRRNPDKSFKDVRMPRQIKPDDEKVDEEAA